MVVNARGTGGRGRVEGRDVAGKTGTAQVISNEGRARAQGHAAATCATTAGSCSSRRGTIREIAGVIFGEHSEHGYLGAPIAKHVIETYFAKKEGRPLPGCRRRCAAAPVPPESDPDSPPVAASRWKCADAARPAPPRSRHAGRRAAG